MANTKKNSTSKKSTKKSTKKATKRNVPATQTRTIVLKKKAFEKDELPEQVNTILVTIKAKGGKVEASDLFVALEKKLETKQPVKAVFAHYQQRLIEDGYIVVNRPEAA